MSIYQELQALSEEDPDEVVRRCTQLLDVNPDDALALFLMGSVYAKAERFGLAINVFKRVCDLKPQRAEAWSNLGMAYQGLKAEKALSCYQQAWSIENKPSYAANIASFHVDKQNYQSALEWANKALKMSPDLNGAWTSYGMANLALGNWKEGWEGSNHSLGGRFRKEVQFKDEPRWNGEKGKTVVVYGEQGLGDEILYASCIPDASRDANIILECDVRLQGLFQRSFPSVTVYGTRRNAAPWIDRHAIDARCAIGFLPSFYRNTRDSFPGTSYLVADPERRVQWRALLDSLGPKPKIGLAWSGGSRHNNPEARHIGLEGFRPLIEAVDADYISLQYKDPTSEIQESGLPVKHWKRACETDDYDDTAALVAELDLVIGVHTSAHHLAGGLGVPGLILVPDKSIWLYANEFPWYSSSRLIHQDGTWPNTMKKVINDSFVRGL